MSTRLAVTTPNKSRHSLSTAIRVMPESCSGCRDSKRRNSVSEARDTAHASCRITDREAGAGRRAALRGPSLCHAAQEEASEIRGRPPRPQPKTIQDMGCCRCCSRSCCSFARVPWSRSSAAACMTHVRGHATCGAACWSRTGTRSMISVGAGESLGWGGAWEGVESSGSTPVMASRSRLHAQTMRRWP